MCVCAVRECDQQIYRVNSEIILLTLFTNTYKIHLQYGKMSDEKKNRHNTQTNKLPRCSITITIRTIKPKKNIGNSNIDFKHLSESELMNHIKFVHFFIYNRLYRYFFIYFLYNLFCS